MRAWSYPLMGKPTVRVHLTTTDASIEGILLHKGLRELHLVGARMIESPDASRALDGTVVIPRETVLCWQRLHEVRL